MPKFKHLVPALFVLLAITGGAATAQTGTSRIAGRVTDSKDAIVSGASVTVTNEATGATEAQTTTEAGLYSFASLPVGNYTVMVEQAGFKKFQKTGNAVEVNTPLTVDIVMEVGQVSEVVLVQGGTEQLQTANATIGNVVQRQAIEQLPLNGRNPLNLIANEPGVVQRSQGGAGSGVHVNGSRDRAFNVTIDGIDANESSAPNPTSNIYRLNPDNVQEYKVTTNNANAEEGRNSGASISVATRSGTNDFHGTGFYFMRNEALNSNEFYSNAQGIAKPKIRLHQPGFEINGPIRKNKTFFFASYQYTKVDFSTPIDQTFGIPTVYTPSALTGSYRFFRADPTCNATTGAGNCFKVGTTIITRNNPLLVNSTTGGLRSDLGVRPCTSSTDVNCVDTHNAFAAINNPRGFGLDSTIGALFRSYPQPNRFDCGDGLNTGCFIWNSPTSHKGPAYNFRIDHTINQNQNVFVRYLQATYNTLGGDPLNGRPIVFPGFAPLGEVFRDTKNLAISHRWTLSARLVNEFTMGFGRFKFLFSQGEANPVFPAVEPFDFVNVSEAFNNTPRTQRAVTVPQFIDNLHIIKDAHQIGLGFNFRFYRHIDRRGQPGGQNVTPSIFFNQSDRSPTSAALGFIVPTLASSTARGINSTDRTRLQNMILELGGLPSSLSQNYLGNLNENAFLPFQSNGVVSLQAIKTVLNQYNLYAQDEWKVRPNLTLNYGVRWEINPAPNTPGYTFVPSTPIVGTPGPANPMVGQPGPVTFVESDKWYRRNNLGALGPRVGLAWSPDGKSGLFRSLFGDHSHSVVRLGYGIAFDPVNSFMVTSVAGSVPGLRTNCTSVVGGTTTPGCTAVPDRTIAGGFPLEVPPPTRRPSEFLTPTLQLNNVAPLLVTFDPEMQLPTVHQWSASFQRELPGGFVMQAAYIGRRGLHLFRGYDVNQINAGPILDSFITMQQNVAKSCTAAGTGCPTGVTGVTPSIVAQGIVNAAFVNSSTVADQLATNAAGSFAARIENTTLAARLRPNQQFGRITYVDTGGNSFYHAAQFTLRRRFASGLGLNLGYTFSKSIDDMSIDPIGTSSGGALSTTTSRAPADVTNFRNERAVSDFDRRHVLTATSVWELPVGRGKRFLRDSGGVLNQVLGGWMINSIFTYMTGEPFQVNSGVFTNNASHVSRADVLDPNLRARLQEIPNVIGPVVFENNRGFAIPAPGSNGSGRNIFTSPSYLNLDLGIVKMFGITERVKLQFRTEMFNALNHPNFDNPRSASVGSPTFTSPQFARACCATVSPNTSTNVIQTGESARVIQFGLKLSF
ncbi:hypothetical protein BH20ACI3_BH20ACI3_03610 [soil metagenome]